MTDLDPHQDEYRGIRNPYHKFDIWDMREQILNGVQLNNIVLTDWNGLDKAAKKTKIDPKFKEKYKKNQAPKNFEIFNPNGEFQDPVTADVWKIYPSPLFPWVEQWWDKMDEE